MTMEKIKRVFEIKGELHPDPAPHKTPEEVMQTFARQYPDLTKCTVAGPYNEEGKQRYKLQGTYGTKG